MAETEARSDPAQDCVYIEDDPPYSGMLEEE